MIRRALMGLLVALLPVVAAAADWQMIPEDSRIGFRGTQAGATFDGRFPAFDAAISFDPEQLETARVLVTIALAKAESGSVERDSALRQPDWFHVAKYPTARFVAAKFRQTGADRYEAEGELTLKGITRKLVLPFTLRISGGLARMDGKLVLNRHDYNIGVGQWVSDQWVGKDVTVTVTVAARRLNKE